MNILVVIVLCTIFMTAIADPFLGLPAMPIPKNNPQDLEKVVLGKQLLMISGLVVIMPKVVPVAISPQKPLLMVFV
mgnify:CR=1 FL=1|jgi:hypothetical protein